MRYTSETINQIENELERSIIVGVLLEIEALRFPHLPNDGADFVYEMIDRIAGIYLETSDYKKVMHEFSYLKEKPKKGGEK